MKFIELRKKVGTQKEFSFLINCDQTTISKWEKGQTMPNAAQFLALCRIYRVRDVLEIGRAHV